MMKKIKVIMIGLMLLVSFLVGQTTCFAADKKINVYLFKGDGCPHCEEALEWFTNELANDSEYSKYYNLVEYEVWYNEDNSKLMNEVAEELGVDASGVPFIVIGDKHMSGFAASTTPDEIKETIKEQYESKDYQDVVKAVKKGLSVNQKGGSIIPIVIVSVIAIVAVLVLVFFTKEKE